MRKNLIIVGAVGLLVIALLLLGLFKDSSSDISGVDSNISRGVTGEPLDITLDFYDAWLEARRSTTTNPYEQNLVNLPALSIAASEKLAQAKSNFTENGFDPVLCQVNIPEKLRTKTVFENENDAQILLLPKDNEVSVQSVVSLKAEAGMWTISDIACSSGEQAPELGEFTFENEGFLLKQSVTPPLDSKYWHLVFAQDNVMGHTAPLLLNENSMCLTTNSSEEVCSDALLMEAMNVSVKGNLTEAGVDVKRIELVK